MKKLLAMAVPILPNQTERWEKFSKILKTEKLKEFKASREALGVHERTFLQHTPMGDFVVVTLEGNDPQGAFAKLGQGKDAFTEWFRKEVKAIHGFDLAEPPKNPLPELFIDSGELATRAGR